MRILFCAQLSHPVWLPEGVKYFCMLSLLLKQLLNRKQMRNPKVIILGAEGQVGMGKWGDYSGVFSFPNCFCFLSSASS